MLNLNNNNIRLISKDIEKLQHLEVLELMGNNLNELPVELANIKTLRQLNVAYNKNLSEECIIFLENSLPNCLVISEIEL